MAQLETIVRPVVFPDIRPAPARTLPPEDNPDQGGAVIRGNPASIITLSYSYSFSASSSHSSESKRQVDEARIYQMDDDGTINRDNFVDIQVPKKIWREGAPQPSTGSQGPAYGQNFPVNKTRKWTETYKKIEEGDNIKIKKTDVIIRNTD